MAETPTRETLIALCDHGFVPEDRWHDRDSARAQRQLGEAYALLRAGCAFQVAASPESTADTWWIEYLQGPFRGHPRRARRAGDRHPLHPDCGAARADRRP